MEKSNSSLARRVLAFLVALVVISCALGDAWEASPSPRDATVSLTKGKDAAKAGPGAAMPSVSTLATGGAADVTGKGAVTPDGTTFFWDLSDASNAVLKGVRPDNGAIFACTGTLTTLAKTNFLSPLTNNGYTLYTLHNALLYPIVVTPHYLSTTGKTPKSASYDLPTCVFGSAMTPLTVAITAATAEMAYGGGNIYYVNKVHASNVIHVISGFVSVGTPGTAVALSGNGASSATPAGGTCAAAVYYSIIGMVYKSGLLYVYATNGFSSFIMKSVATVAACTSGTDVTVLAGGTVANPHVAGNGVSAKFNAIGGGIKTAGMVNIGDYLYVASGYGIVSVNTVSPYAVSKYIVGSDTAASGAVVNTIGSYATSFGPFALLGTSPTVSGVLYFSDSTAASAGSYLIRKVSWTGDAKSKVKVVNPAKGGKGKM